MDQLVMNSDCTRGDVKAELEAERESKCQDVGECSTSSAGVPTSSLLQLFRAALDSDEVDAALEAYPELSEILATKRRALAKSCCERHGRIELTSRCLLTVLCEASVDDETLAGRLLEVIRDVEVMHTGRDSELLGFLLFRCAKILYRLDCRTQALRACNSALQIIAGHPCAVHLHQAILFLRDNQTRDVKIVSLGVKTSINRKDTEDCELAKLESLLTGIFRGRGRKNLHPAFQPQMVEEIVNAALKREEESNCCDAAKLATIRLTLAEYHFGLSLASRQEICLGLLRRAITEFKQVDSKCCRYYMRAGYEDELFGGNECPCHQLLGKAFLLQGHLLKHRGATAEALQSCEDGKKLFEHSNRDKPLLRLFYLLSCSLKQAMYPGSLVYGYEKLSSDLHSGRDVMDLAGMSDVEEAFRLAGFNIRSVFDREVLNAQLVQYMNQPQRSRERARNHIINLLSTENDISASKDQFNLAVQAMKYAAAEMESTVSAFHESDHYMHELMIMGQLALSPDIMELDHAYYLWSQVYKISEEKLEDLAEISEVHAIHYFEQIKHACMALAKCELYRMKLLMNQRELFSSDEPLIASNKCLLWAERGKGKMLSLSNMQDFKARAQDLRISDWGFSGHDSSLDPRDSDSELVAFKTRFHKDDDFAQEFLHKVSFIEKKSVFIEYTFLDQNQLLITLVFDGGAKYILGNDLSRILDDDTKRDAEEELSSLRNEPFTRRAESSRASSSDTKEPSSPRSSEKLKEFSSPESEVPSWMNEYGVNRAPYNDWIPGMAAGIQRRAAAAQKMHVSYPDQSRTEEEKIRGLLQKLYAILIKPFREDLNRLSATDTEGLWTLVFVPHEDLGVVPFAALHEKDGSPYLIEEYAMSISPAIWVSHLMKLTYEGKVNRDTECCHSLLVGRKSGYPKHPESWPDLNEAHKEVNAVAKALKPMPSSKMLDDETDSNMGPPTKDQVMKYLPGASWIHLSVHGEISSEYPQGSLLLGGSDSQRLTAADIIESGNRHIIGDQDSKWAARCAIASACQSGLGAVAGGGIMGFARAFMLAGVPSCVLSLWKVNEAFSTEFMGKLYTELRKPGKTLGDAMQSTITSMLKETKRRRRKPSERGTTIKATELRWSILDWAAYSCFGFPGVQLPHHD